MDILYTVNPKYIDIMLGSICSLVMNGDMPCLRIHIITSNFTMDDYLKIQNILDTLNIEYYFYDVKDYDIEKYGIPNWRGTQIANARLFFQEYLQDRLSGISKLLYLDADTITVSSLSNINGYASSPVAAAKDIGLKRYARRLNVKTYYNSGVLLINVNKWLDDDCERIIADYLETCSRELIFPDQDIINCAFAGRINELPLSYNTSASCFLFGDLGLKIYFNPLIRSISYEEAMKAKKEPKILHATGLSGIKPWSNNNINPYNQEFAKYIKMFNPDFEHIPLNQINSILNKLPIIFKLSVLAKGYLPDDTQRLIRKITN